MCFSKPMNLPEIIESSLSFAAFGPRNLLPGNPMYFPAGATASMAGSTLPLRAAVMSEAPCLPLQCRFPADCDQQTSGTGQPTAKLWEQGSNEPSFSHFIRQRENYCKLLIWWKSLKKLKTQNYFGES